MIKLRQLLFCLPLVAGLCARAAETNSLVWLTASDLAADSVSAELRGKALWPLLEDIAHQTGWHIFVEPGAAHVASTKFSSLPAGEALHKLLGDLNFALVPKTNGPTQLYVFTTTMKNATQAVAAGKRVVKRQKHVANELIVKLKPGADIDALAKSLGAKVTGRDEKAGIYRLEFADAAATDAALAKLQGNSEVAAVDYNYIFDAPPAPQMIANAPASATPALTLETPTKNDPCSPVVGLIDTQVQSLGSQLDPILLKAISVVGDLPANTASAPISMASAACEGAPRPASTTTGTLACSMMISMLGRVSMPRALPMGEPSGMTVAHPTSSSRLASTGSALMYGSTVNPSFTSVSAAFKVSTGSGSK